MRQQTNTPKGRKSLKERLAVQKPWAVMGISRAHYQAKKPWKSAKGKMSKEQFEEMILLIAEEKPDIFDRLRDEADAERLVQAMFGPEAEF